MDIYKFVMIYKSDVISPNKDLRHEALFTDLNVMIEFAERNKNCSEQQILDIYYYKLKEEKGMLIPESVEYL